MPISYSPSVTGSAINSAISGVTFQLRGEATKEAGAKVWQTALMQIYADFDTTLAQGIMAYISTAQVMFPPAISVPMVPIMPILGMSSIASGSGSDIDSAIKGKTASLQGAATGTAGITVWTEFVKQVGKDLMEKVPPAVCNCCAIAVMIVPPGFAAPPMTMSLAPAPPIYKGLQAGQLKSMMQGYFSGGILSLGPQIDSMIKGQTSSLQGDAVSSAGETVWQSVMDTIATPIALQIGMAIQLFFTASIGVWGTTPVPGMPITPGGPTPGGASAPATIIIA